MTNRRNPRQPRRNAGEKAIVKASAASVPTRAERRSIIEDVVARVRESGERIRQEFLKVGDLVYEARFGRNEEAVFATDLNEDDFFCEITRAIERLELGFTHARLSVLVRIVALDDSLDSQYWQKLDAGRKELLLPLKTDADRKAGAKYAFQMKPTHEVLKSWVRDRLAQAGTPVTERGVTLRAVEGSLDHLARVDSAKSLERVGKGVRKLKPKERQALRSRVRAARAALDRLEALLDEEDE